ncbi:MAG: hypothetical protein N3E38_01345 [Candidatus Aenigmarchaeota archaeon]|nr:hypothetical protein [Candidatus Aenigmarchaeota archaeon]MCX8179366.1 hypothetical protein [Candidatus Aenigmarchaeota archaeon]
MVESWKTKRKGYWLYKEGKVKVDVETQKRIYFKVLSENEHSVIFDKIKNQFACDCEYFSLKLKDCSHIYAVKLFLKGG